MCVAETLPDSLCFLKRNTSWVQCDCINLHVMRSTAPTFLVFFHRKCASQESCRIPWVHFPCVFSSKISLGFTSDCEFTCDAASRSRILYLFSRKRALRKPFQIPGVFSMKMHLGFNVIKLCGRPLPHSLSFSRKCGAANRSGTPITFFQGKRASQEDSSRSLTAIANFPSYPSQEESQLLTKEHCTGDVGLFDSQFLKNRGSLL